MRGGRPTYATNKNKWQKTRSHMSTQQLIALNIKQMTINTCPFDRSRRISRAYKIFVQ